MWLSLQANLEEKKVNDLSKYNIEIIGLKNKVHSYQYDIGDRFFSNFEESELQKGALNCWLNLNKTDNFIEVNFKIQGKVELVCDRSLDNFDHDIAIDQNIMFKFGEEDKVIDDDIEMISRDRQSIQVGQYIYELIATSTPMKKLHPRYQDEETDRVEDELIYSSSTEDSEKKEKSEKEDQVDPRWEALKKLKNQLN